MSSKRCNAKMTTDKKARMSVPSRIAAFAIAAAVVLADQLSKFAIVRTLVTVESRVTVIPGILDFYYIRNSGAVAGLLSNHRWVFMVVSTVVIILVSVYLSLGKAETRLGAVSLALILGGGIGNMIDRVAYGEVVDFFDVTCVDFFPFNTSFNVADSCVCIGRGLLLLSVIISEIKMKRSNGTGNKDVPEAEPDVSGDTDGK